MSRYFVIFVKLFTVSNIAYSVYCFPELKLYQLFDLHVYFFVKYIYMQYYDRITDICIYHFKVHFAQMKLNLAIHFFKCELTSISHK